MDWVIVGIVRHGPLFTLREQVGSNQYAIVRIDRDDLRLAANRNAA